MPRYSFSRGLLRSQCIGAALVLAATHFWAVLLTASAPAADLAPAAAPRQTVAEMLPSLHLLEPVWHSRTVHRESVLFLETDENQPATGKLLFPPEKILAVHSADGRHEYEAGRDFLLASGASLLTLTAESHIPRLTAAQLFPPKDAKGSLPHKMDDKERGVLFDNGHWFHDQQIEVTYVHAQTSWPGPTPSFSGKHLPKTLAKLRGKGRLTLAVSGDSISQGYNASGFSQAPPWMPPYPDLVAAQLRAVYGAEVVLHNRAISGWNVPRGLDDLDSLLATQPDLVIIAYGMNDVGGRNPDGFRANITTLIERIRRANDQTEMILVSPMLGNADWVHTPREMFPRYRDALASLAGPGVVLADMTTLWQEFLRRKREVDLTGNGVNHPSDFGHRMYAQVILALLVESQADSP